MIEGVTERAPWTLATTEIGIVWRGESLVISGDLILEVSVGQAGLERRGDEPLDLPVRGPLQLSATALTWRSGSSSRRSPSPFGRRHRSRVSAAEGSFPDGPDRTEIDLARGQGRCRRE